MEEVIRSLVQSGRLKGPPGNYSAREPITKLGLPATVQSVIAARTGQLQESDRSALQVAAVIEEFPVDLLGRVTGFDFAQLERSLVHLQREGFISEKQVFPARVYVFKHALIEDVVYGVSWVPHGGAFTAVFWRRWRPTMPRISTKCSKA